MFFFNTRFCIAGLLESVEIDQGFVWLVWDLALLHLCGIFHLLVVQDVCLLFIGF